MASTANNKEKIVPCLVSFQGNDWENLFKVRSPTGKTVTLRCNGRWNQMSMELLLLINKYQHADAKKFQWSSTPAYPEKLPYRLMQEIKDLAFML